MEYGRLVNAAVGLALVVTGVIVALVASSVTGIVILIVGLFPLAMGLSDWQEFEAQAKGAAVKLRLVKYPLPGAAPEPHAADVHLLEIQATGGDAEHVDFRAEVVNYGTQQTRWTVRAEVDGQTVWVGNRGNATTHVDLIPNLPPTRVRIFVPRPGLGNLVPEFSHETTLYGRTLRVIASDGEREVTREWHETIYDESDNAARHAIQQRVWRLGRGVGTDADVRAEAQSDLLRRHEERRDRP